MDIKEIRHGFRTTVSGDFRTSAEAYAAKEKYLSAFPAMAYGTVIAVNHNPDTQLWELRGNRSASCD